MSEVLRVVFDTQIFLRSLINPKSVCGKLVNPVWREHYQLYISDAIEAEIVDVLTRPSLRRKFPQITDQLVQETTRILYEDANRVRVEIVEAISRDPKDDIFLACAKAVQANYLVSEDNDLLVLNPYNGTEIITALDFLDVLQSI